ncbi:MAG: hypothetical protein MUO38_08245, partial [Anaerolineales bacterium]|nr:hypothetical protein [Anaerolineales bacterium]
LDHVRDAPSPSWPSTGLEETKRNVMRKAQFGFGWDWGPRLPTVGIWREVELRRQRQAAIQRVRLEPWRLTQQGNGRSSRSR